MSVTFSAKWMEWGRRGGKQLPSYLHCSSNRIKCFFKPFFNEQKLFLLLPLNFSARSSKCRNISWWKYLFLDQLMLKCAHVHHFPRHFFKSVVHFKHKPCLVTFIEELPKIVVLKFRLALLFITPSPDCAHEQAVFITSITNMQRWMHFHCHTESIRMGWKTGFSTFFFFFN